MANQAKFTEMIENAINGNLKDYREDLHKMGKGELLEFVLWASNAGYGSSIGYVADVLKQLQIIDDGLRDGITPRGRKRHGGPWDRGSADSYYRRGRNPHYFEGDSYNSLKVGEGAMTKGEIADYNAGFDFNEELGDYKDWG